MEVNDKMIKVELYDVDTFKDCFDAISKIVDEMELLFTETGLKLTCMSRNHVTMVYLRLDDQFFSTYEVKGETGVYIDTEEFFKVLKRCSKNDVLTLTTEDNFLKITSEGMTTKTFKVKIIDSEYSSPTLQPLEGDYVTMPSDILKEVITDINGISERIKLTLDNETLIFDSPGTFTEASIEYLHNNIVTGNCRGSYNIQQIMAMLKAYKVSDAVDLTFGVDTPLQVDFSIDNGLGLLRFFLAPIVDEE